MSPGITKILDGALNISYPLMRDLWFVFTKKDPESAHESLIKLSPIFAKLPSLPYASSRISISNASGLNKNADLHPRFFSWCGFDRIVIGTVTPEPRQGNPRPRAFRLTDTRSMINNMGLPNLGANGVAENLAKYGSDGLPVTLSLTHDPAAEPAKRAGQINGIIETFSKFSMIDRLELNVSCPNVSHASNVMGDFKTELNDLIASLGNNHEIYLKIAPVQEDSQLATIIEVSDAAQVRFVVANTLKNAEATDLNRDKIPEIPGGVSGAAIYKYGHNLRERMIKMGVEPHRIIACGGIDSSRKVQACLDLGLREFQLYTPLIYEGPNFPKQLKSAFPN